MRRINEVLEKLIDECRRLFRQTLDFIGSFLGKEQGNEDFGLLFKEACFVVLSQVLSPFYDPPCSLPQDHRDAVRVVLHLVIGSGLRRALAR